MSTLEQNKQIARDFFAALGSFDFDGLMQLMSTDAVFNVQNTGCLGGQIKLTELAATAGVLAEACPDGIRFDVVELTAEDNRVSCRVDGYAKTSDGGDYNNQYHFLMHIDDGKIVESFEYMDSLLVEKLFAPLIPGS